MHTWQYVRLESTWAANANNQGGFRISWACEIGFGQLTFYTDVKGVLCCHNELMDEEFCQEVLTEFYQRAFQV